MRTEGKNHLFLASHWQISHMQNLDETAFDNFLSKNIDMLPLMYIHVCPIYCVGSITVPPLIHTHLEETNPE